SVRGYVGVIAADVVDVRGQADDVVQSCAGDDTDEVGPVEQCLWASDSAATPGVDDHVIAVAGHVRQHGRECVPEVRRQGRLLGRVDDAGQQQPVLIEGQPDCRVPERVDGQRAVAVGKRDVD